MPAIKVAAVPSAEEHLQNIAASSETLNESYDCEKDLIMDLSDMDNDNDKVWISQSLSKVSIFLSNISIAELNTKTVMCIHIHDKTNFQQ